MTREEAIKELESYAVASWGDLNEVFEMAISALREQPRWISVEERLPEPNRVVLVRRMPVLGGRGYTAVDHVLAGPPYDGGTWFEDLHTWKSFVTHWMPLPEPPEVEV